MPLFEFRHNLTTRFFLHQELLCYKALLRDKPSGAFSPLLHPPISPKLLPHCQASVLMPVLVPKQLGNWCPTSRTFGHTSDDTMSTTSKPSGSDVCRTSCHTPATQPLPSPCLCLLSQITNGYGRALGGDKASGMRDAHRPSIPPQCSAGHFVPPPRTALVAPDPTSPSNSFKAPYLPLQFSGSPAPYGIYRSSTCPAAAAQLARAGLNTRGTEAGCWQNQP